MNKKEWEIRVMQYFAENMNLPRCMEVAKQCAQEILGLKFNDIALGNYELPSDPDVKEQVAQKIPYEFDPEDFIQNGPLDFSGLDDDTVSEALKKVEALYQKFREAEAKVVAKAARNNLEQFAENIKTEMHHLRKKYLS